MAIQGRTLIPLIPFDMIFSMDIGIIRFLKESCVDNELFDLDRLHNMSDREILSLTQSRKDINPLSILNINGDADSIYKELKETYNEHIIDCAPITDFAYSVYSMCVTGNGTDPYILVSDDYQKEKLHKSFFGKFSIKLAESKIRIIKSDCIETNMDIIDPYFLNSYDGLYHHKINDSFYDKLVGKTIYLAETEYNREFLKKFEFGKVSKNNAFITIKLWKEEF